MTHEASQALIDAIKNKKSLDAIKALIPENDNKNSVVNGKDEQRKTPFNLGCSDRA